MVMVLVVLRILIIASNYFSYVLIYFLDDTVKHYLPFENT